MKRTTALQRARMEIAELKAKLSDMAHDLIDAHNVAHLQTTLIAQLKLALLGARINSMPSSPQKVRDVSRWATKPKRVKP